MCLYYKCNLPLKVIDVSYPKECINFEVKIGDKTCNFVSLYTSPSQTKDEFKCPFLIVALGDFNVRMQDWSITLSFDHIKITLGCWLLGREYQKHYLQTLSAHGDMYSIWMLKLCDKSNCKPLNIIITSCLAQAIFPSEWKKANAIPIHKKNKQCVKNYRPVSLLPIWTKVLNCIIYNMKFTYFIENNLISENQSGFKPGDSRVSQLLAITHEIFSSFDDNHKVRGVFLDISKVFDKVWHEGIIHKLKHNGVLRNLSSFLTDFLRK